MNKFKEKLSGFVNSKNKNKIIIAVGVIGILLILLSEVNLGSGESKKDKNPDTDYASYVNSLNAELTELLSSIDGVGECRVMITLRNTSESVYAKNSDSSSSDNSKSSSDEYVIYDSENGDSPILLKENFPDIEGVAIVCSGGDNIAVKEKVIKCVSALFNISSNRISVTKLHSKGDNNGRK